MKYYYFSFSRKGVHYKNQTQFKSGLIKSDSNSFPLLRVLQWKRSELFEDFTILSQFEISKEEFDAVLHDTAEIDLVNIY